MMADPATPHDIPSPKGIPRHRNSQQPRKLRDSCTHCASSKVRCDKEKPACSRCVRRRLTCEYKVSRRTGRTSRAGHRAPATAPTAKAGCVSTCININSSTSILPPSLAAGDSSQTSLLAPPTALPNLHSSSEHCLAQTPDMWGSLLSPSALYPDVADLSSLIPTGSDVGDIFASVMQSPPLDTCDIESPNCQGLGNPLSVTEQPLLNTPAMSETQSVGLDDTSSNDPTCCMTMVLDILSNLFKNAPSTCKQSEIKHESGRARTIASVIAQNKEIVETINTVLNCRCSEDSYLIYIVSLAVFKVMSRYVAAARDRSPTSQGIMEFVAEATKNSSRGDHSPDEQVLQSSRMPGNYCVDGDDQNRMAAQLVLSELHRVQHVVNVLSSRLESIRLRACLSSTPISSSVSTAGSEGGLPFTPLEMSPLSGTTFFQLEQDLRKRLRAVSSEAIDILRHS
ncbi:Zn(II)2Cys6 transcription factor [Aspergillus lucknowensis]|uniref:Aflatoxin regulatory protein-domain-containing protein n=1 Tax=Aspergillus lucknowensis TaxID=176173 RepID=A0ABR4M4W9_9EURO